ncbi:MAG: Nucleoside-diphosphate-sugar epimerase [Thermodesulfobacterium sp.]|uniref:ADP-L-glycero-D-manno-heptose-6-epimerase n=1 Tax=Candidatus Thermodesulfobacterium syntrophicum TaxID=3060442 RepID=A0AAE3P6B1_9BACT|nr:Nucleoside-diphosphate-sugar epimerase [Candidatus Thermodesulfobacterium syntrophicum]
MKKAQIVVTGGAGFIGSNLVEVLNQRGEDQIIIVDHLGEGNKWKNLLGLKFLDYIEKGEFLEKIEKGYFKEVSAIIHLGACSNTTEKNLQFLYLNNYKYSQKLALFSLENNIQFIYASSAATYGEGSLGFSDDETLLPKLKPLNPYGFSKHLFDLWLYYNGLLNKVVGLKYFNVFGEKEFHKGEMRSVVLKAYEQIKKEEKVKLFKSYNPDYRDGEQLRDFIYVKDAVEVTLFFLENPQIKGIFNVGTGKARSFKDLVLAIFSALNIPPTIEYIEMPEYLKKQYQYFTQADITKLRKAGYNKPMWELEDAVKNYVTYLEKNYTFFYG